MTYNCRFWLLLVLMGVFLTARAQDSTASAWLVKGYLKNMQQWTFTSAENSLLTGGFFHNRVVVQYMPDSLWTFDAEFRTRLFYGEWVRFQPDMAQSLDADKGLVDLSFVPLRRPALVGSVLADRLWGQWNRGKWRIRVGRQRINWGMTLTWNPNDWFNAWNFLDFDYEERPGSDALRVQYQKGDFGQFDLAVSPARMPGQWVGALRYGDHTGCFDWQLLGGVYRRQLALGAGWAGDVGQAGLKGEVSLFYPLDSVAGAATSVNATLEVNTVVADDWFLNSAILLNTNGIGGSTDLFRLTQTKISADNLMPGKMSCLVSVSHPFSPILQGSCSLVYSPNGHLIIGIPSIAWSAAERWDVDLTGQLFWLESPARHVYNAGNALYLRTRWSF